MIDQRKQDVWQLAQDILGPLDHVIHQPYGHSGMTFEVRCPSGDYMIKTRDETGTFDHSEHHIEVLSELGVPTPIIRKRGTFRGFEFMLLDKVPGRDLGHELGSMNHPQITRLAEQIVAIERSVTALPKGAGYGWTPMEVPGPFPSWTAIVERDAKTAPTKVREIVRQWKTYFDAVEPICFLDDLTVKNVIVQNGELQGIVDLDWVCYGDPLYWLSLAEVTVILDVGPQASFYGDELRRLWGMSDEAAVISNLYNVIQAWFFLSRDHSNEALRDWSANRSLHNC